jgi:hypothetical protein
MKKFLFFILASVIFFACKKDSTISKQDGYPAIILVKGILHYDNFPDGWGLYYVTDSNENLIFKNNFPTSDAQYQYYKSYVNTPTELSYTGTGITGCLYGFGPTCGVKVVEVYGLK